MTGPGDDMPEREALAAEYVLGTLPLAERLAAEALIESDTGFRMLVEAWKDRLAPLDAGYPEVTPPADLFARIETRLFPAQAKRRRAWIWGSAAAAALAALAAVAVLPTLTAPPPVTATLTGENQALTVAARYDSRAQTLTVERTSGPAAGTGTDYELWLIPAGQSAISIGLVRDAALTIPVTALPPGTTLAITLEPEGGSPTGVATGPLLVATVIGGA